jgi:hypothetical protein
MHILARATLAAVVVLCCGSFARGAVEYPFNAVLDARVQTAAASVVASVSISVERLMEESRRVRVTDALKYNGYPGFLKALRALPPVGTIGVGDRLVEIRYAHEQVQGEGRRLVLAADAPLFFLGADSKKARAGYELTIVELNIGPDGGISGTMTGAARVKPGGEGLVVVDDYAEAPVHLSGHPRRP